MYSFGGIKNFPSSFDEINVLLLGIMYYLSLVKNWVKHVLACFKIKIHHERPLSINDVLDSKGDIYKCFDQTNKLV